MQPPSRQLPTKVVRGFRGISQFKNIVQVPMDHALSLLNVFISTSGALEKIRLPFVLTPAQPSLIDTFFDFQQANGLRQLVFNAGNRVGYFIVPIVGGVEQIPYVPTTIEDNPLNSPRWSWVNSNNILFGANGQRMQKWTGAAWQQMGIGVNGVSPPAPTIGVTMPLTSIQRTGGVITFAYAALNAGTKNLAAGYDQAALTGALSAGLPITISGVVGDATMNGSFVTNAPNAGHAGTYVNAGANAGPFFGDGFVTIYYIVGLNGGNNVLFPITSAGRKDGVVTLGLFPSPSSIIAGENMIVAGMTGVFATFNGTWKVTSDTISGVQFAQPGLPDVATAAPAAGTIAFSNSNLITGRTWRYSYANSVTGLVGPASLPSVTMPGGGLLSNVRDFVTAPPATDPQVDTIWWFGTLDGGGDYAKVLSAPTNAGGNINVLGDARDDSLLDLTQQAPLINFAPPVGSKFAKFQNRLFLAGIVGAPQDIAYSAYEQVLTGNRPEECWFPSNRIRMAIGADDIRGFGVILPGVVAFSHSNQMFMFQGQVEDITTTLPVNFTALMQELPWSTGCTSHAAIQSTPYGIVWVAADLSVKIWNGVFYGTIIGPRDLSENVYPLMRRITPGTAPLIQSAFFNFVERDWFAINACLDGAVSPNYLIFFDLSQQASDNLGVFIAEPLLPMDSLGVREDNNGGRHLVLSSGGQLYEMKVQSEQTNGIIVNQSATNGVLPAFWQSGLAGSDTPHQFKMFRYGHIIADQTGFNIIATIIDDEAYTLTRPLTKLMPLKDGKFTVDYSAKRVGLTIIFPSQDVSASVQQLDVSWIGGSER